MKKTVLVIEDDSDQRMMFVDVIRKMGFKVEDTNCISDALRILSSSKFDLLVTDYILGDGLTADNLMKIARNDRASFAILVTGMNFSVKEAPRGFDVILKKPVFENDIVEAVDFVLGKNRSYEYK